MDVNQFRTIGECEFGATWYVQNEGKVVVNAYQAALYFSPQDFFQFAQMIEQAAHQLASFEAPQPRPKAGKVSDIRQFRTTRQEED